MNVAAVTTGANRTTLKSKYRINGTSTVTRGSQYGYTRGSSYGQVSVGQITELDLSASDYIECAIEVDDTDATYTTNTIPAECEFIIRKID